MPGDRSAHDRLIGAGATGNDQAQRRVSTARLRERLDQPGDILARLNSRLHGQHIRRGKGHRGRRLGVSTCGVWLRPVSSSLVHDTNTGGVGAHLAH